MLSKLSRNFTRFPTRVFSGHTSSPDRPSVACMLIGDEILNGKTLDVNGNELAKTCSQYGMSLKRIVTVPDNTQDICDEITNLSRRYNYVFTSGGVGPTHDDITYESIASAFNLNCKYHEPTLKRMSLFLNQKNKPLTNERKRMALFPTGSRVFFTCDPPTKELAEDETADESVIKQAALGECTFQPLNNFHPDPPAPTIWTPVVVLGNIHILPGPPALFKYLVHVYFTQYLMQKHPNIRPLFKKSLGTSESEGDLAYWLSQVQKRFRESVQIGSYPVWENSLTKRHDSNVILVFQGANEKAVLDCVELAKKKINLKEL